MRERPHAVPLNFEEPVGVGKKLIRKRGEHGTDAGGHRAFAHRMEIRRLDRDWISFWRKLLLDFVNRSAGENAAVVCVDLVSGVFGGVLVLDEEPLIAFFTVLDFDENETAAKLFAIEDKFEVTFFELRFGVEISFDEEAATVPNHNGSGAIAAFGDFSFKAAIFERMIFGLNGQAFVGCVERRTFGDGPGFESAVDGQAKIVMEASCGMLLHDKNVFGGETGSGGAFEDGQFRIRQAFAARTGLGWGFEVARRFGGAVKLPFAPVLL